MDNNLYNRIAVLRAERRVSRQELADIIGDLLARGESHNVAALLLHATYVQLKVYAARQS